MDCRLPLIRLAHILKRHVVVCLNTSISMALVVRSCFCDEEGSRLTIPIPLLPPGRSLFSRWNRKILLLLIYFACSLFSVQKLFLKKSFSLAQWNLVHRLQRWRVILYRLIALLSCYSATRLFDALPK